MTRTRARRDHEGLAMNHNDTSPGATSPAEYAGLVRDARQLVIAVERATRRTAAVFVAAMSLTVAATALRVPVAGEVASVVAVVAFTAALVMVMARISLGPMPPHVDPDARSTPPSTSDGTSATNAGISRM